MKKKVFIDTNIYLDFYHYSNDDLEKLKDLNRLTNDIKDLELIITDQIVAEYQRNRENKIADALNTFKQQAIKIEIPRLFDQFEKTKELSTTLRSAQTIKKDLELEGLKAIQGRKLAADEVIDILFEEDFLFDDKIIKTQSEDIQAAEMRIQIGNPPGKKGSFGDAINWEILMRSVPDGENLIIISGDGDFASSLDKKKLNPFLKQEWENEKASNITFYGSISDFFINEYGSVELDEIEKEKLIQDLETSGSFDKSRAVLSSLIKFKEFTETQINRIVNASLENPQIFSAHAYSPSLIGGKLSQLIKNHEELIENYSELCKRFSINKLFRDRDLPF